MKKLYLILSLLLFIYMAWPSPLKVSQFASTPDSIKSTLEGDTIQIPNVAGYFSNNYRDDVLPFYQKDYWSIAKLPFAPYRLNYPPEYSFVAIKPHTDTTFLEELVYPMRDSLYINGFEPFYKNGEPKYWGASEFSVGGKAWETKTTIRLYSSSIISRIIVWLGICISTLLIFRLSKKILISR